MRYLLLFVTICYLPLVHADKTRKRKPLPGYVSVHLTGQLGNQLFQIATAYAYALDHNLPLTIPDLVQKNEYGIPYNAQRLFLAKIASHNLISPPLLQWTEPSYNYTKIPEARSIDLRGFFQSEKYFKHRRAEILSLFAAPEGLNQTILEKYPILASDELVVGVQIRDYRPERPLGDYHPTLGRCYYENATALFPKDTIFIVSSNNPNYAKSCMDGLSSQIIYLEDNYINEFYTLVLCKSFITSNSSFGWWASWLSVSPNKTVIAPDFWFSSPFNYEEMLKDLYPEGATVIPSRSLVKSP